MRDGPDMTRLDLREPDGTARIVDALHRQGMALFCGVRNRGTLLCTGRTVMSVRTHRDSDADGVTTIQRRFAFAATGSLAGFTDRELSPHTDGSSVAQPPRVLMLACFQRPRSGGEVMLVDGEGLYHQIAASDPTMLDVLRGPRSAYFGGASGYLGSVFEEGLAGRMTVRLRFYDLARFSPAVSLYMGKLRELVRHRAVTLDLAVGEGYVVLNDRWLHGRSRFTGDRVMLRLLGDPLPEHQIAPGFEPVSTELLPSPRLSSHGLRAS
jgi:Taurine catabolism dioxygenase TauD, TfdA family